MKSHPMSNYEKLEEEITKIVSICEKLPENYRMKCFDFLMNQILISDQPPTEKPPENSNPQTSQKIQIPIDIRAFMSQYSLDENIISKLFLIEAGEIRPIYKIKTTKKSKAQLQIALLTSLENTLKNPNLKFEFSSEDIRKRCNDLQCYDMTNFSSHFKNNKALFKSLDDLEHIQLSSDGKSELADVITEIAK